VGCHARQTTTADLSSPVTAQIATRVRQLTADRVPFVHATVVRAQVPTSAKAGDDAIVLLDGSIEGFVGGQCAEQSVRAAALGALEDGQTLLLRVLPEGDADFPDSPGARVVVNPCLSGGALEIFLEPMLPPPLVEVVGHTPVADSIVAMAELLGYEAVRSGTVSPQAAAVIIASHGRDENGPLRAALDAEVPYIALVASRRRGAAVLDELGLSEVERALISTPAGLDLGARTAPEVALSILAEVITSVRSNTRRSTSTGSAPRTAVDPICGMTVTVMPDTAFLHIEGQGDVWFCGTGCRDAYARQYAPKVV
jgi:xanthine dehydrogenase accessory factor